MISLVIDTLLDGFFAAIAAVGFAAVSDPRPRSFPYIALLAAVGHALRYVLMNFCQFDIASASFLAGLTIGMGSLWLGRCVHQPVTCLYIPALLPMIPGIYAYRTVFALILTLHTHTIGGYSAVYMQEFFLNGTISVTVIIVLAAGATLPVFLFPKLAYAMTRHLPRQLTEEEKGLAE